MVSSSSSVATQKELSPGQQILKWIQENRVNSLNKKHTLNSDTIQKIANGEYGISLEKFGDLYTYDAEMNAIYGKHNFLSNPKAEVGSAKEFLDAMEERGISNKTALKLYTTLKTYSINKSFLNKNSFVNAKI